MPWMGMSVYDILIGADPIYDDRATRYLEIIENAIKQYDQKIHQQLRKGLLDTAIDRRLSSNTKESLAMAAALWDRSNVRYPGLLDRPRPALKPSQNQ